MSRKLSFRIIKYAFEIYHVMKALYSNHHDCIPAESRNEKLQFNAVISRSDRIMS
ncbi:hypothetical protein [Bacillus pakistanensis]|uniref:hypothetical protein n=1 Tax=Rossellomorea pakistanensis TaxID=992288 RepID=UPI001966C0E3|nr:hypothetical protein [Bacillus pakistanensis]